MANIFDEVLYPSYPFPESHPDRLAAQAQLLGMTPPPLDSCRVLELGCGEGANVIPMAYGMPGARFVGIDRAARPVSMGQAMIKALGLGNIALRAMDILDCNFEPGQFDYIIAHGVYSWAPAEVQHKLLRICSESLAPNGIAYISYNTYPGGHIREMLRRMMLYYTRGIADPAEVASQGLALLSGLVESMKESDPHRLIIEPEVNRMLSMRPESLIHDDLAEFNSPLYFYEFVERAEKLGLQFLAEAESFPAPAGQSTPPDAGARADEDNVIIREQFFDFRVFRKFRSTLLCRRGVALDRPPKPEHVRRLYISSPAQPESARPDLRSSNPETFRSSDGKITVTSNHPLTKAAMHYLGAHWPERIAFDDLSSCARKESGWAPEDGGGPALEDMLLKMFGGTMVEFHALSPHFAVKAGERPVATALARYQLSKREFATNLLHQTVNFDDVARHFILLMDGTRDRPALLREMERRAASGELTVEQNGEPVRDAAKAREVLENGMDQNLAKLARLAMLVA
ncbi:MAG: methyltransferase regulatory domain-containing protein [Acidobacteriota bacterium]|nr:methyltransferase regulatory domain-containing protein [Acidobacteriota bacterium]